MLTIRQTYGHYRRKSLQYKYNKTYFYTKSDILCFILYKAVLLNYTLKKKSYSPDLSEQRTDKYLCNSLDSNNT